MKILVVDDMAPNRLILAALLKRAGYEVRSAADSAEAKRLFSEDFADAVLTDYHLAPGDVTGLELAKDIRMLAGDHPLRIALLTGDSTPVLRTEGLVDAVLVKPASLEVLTTFLEGNSK